MPAVHKSRAEERKCWTETEGREGENVGKMRGKKEKKKRASGHYGVISVEIPPLWTPVLRNNQTSACHVPHMPKINK